VGGRVRLVEICGMNLAGGEFWQNIYLNSPYHAHLACRVPPSLTTNRSKEPLLVSMPFNDMGHMFLHP
jgi:hypothetical protein